MVSYLDVASIESTSHLDGRLSLAYRGGLPALLEEGDEVFLVPPKTDLLRSAHVESVAYEGGGKALVRFREVDSLDVAEKLVGMHCLIDKAKVSSSDSFAYSAAEDVFRDWTFYDKTSRASGRIISSWSFAGNLLGDVALDSEGDTETSHMIPLADDLVVDVDEDAKHLTLALARGIFDL